MSLTGDCVIWSQDDERITVVSQLSPTRQRKRAEKVARKARDDTPYQAEDVFGVGMEVRAFLLDKEGCNIGILVTDKRNQVWQASWEELAKDKKPKELPNHSPIWSMGLVWVETEHRGNGFARTMLDKAMDFLGCRLDNIGWYTPFTPSGEAFVRSCCPKEFLIAK